MTGSPNGTDTPGDEIEDPLENLESQRGANEDEDGLSKIDFATEDENEASGSVDAQEEREKMKRQDTSESTKVKLNDTKKEGALIGHAATLADLEKLLQTFVEQTRTSLQETQQKEPEQAIDQYRTVVHNQPESQIPFHGTHPGLAGHRATPSTVGGQVRRGGGPSAPQNIRQASSADGESSTRPTQVRQRSSAFGGGTSLGQADSRRTNTSRQQPSFHGPSRFPGGDVIEAQESLHAPHSRATSAHSSMAEDGTTADHQLDSHDEEDVTIRRLNVLRRGRWRIRKFVAEFMCTTFLLVIGTSVQCQVRLSQGAAGLYESINWAWGFAVLCTVHLAGGISGAHANPGITVALTLLRRFPVSLLPVYVAAQTLGAFVGAAIAYGIYLPAIDVYQGKGIRTISGENETGSLFVTVPDSMATPATAFFNEIVASAILGLVVFAVGDDSNSPPGDGMSGLIIGITVTMIGMSLGWQTGYAVNMARDFGPRVLLSCLGYESDVWTHNSYWWIYGPIVGTIAGTTIGCVLYDICLFTREDSPLYKRWQPQVAIATARRPFITMFGRRRRKAPDNQLTREASEVGHLEK